MPTYNRNRDVVRIGEIGEEIVSELLAGSERTDDWYDSKKDGVYNEMTYEVKTFRLNHKTKSFWVDKTQWRKVDQVDMLFFVKVPEHLDEELKVYLCINHKNCWKHYYKNDGTMVRGYPLTSCIPYGSIDDDRATVVYENSIASSKHGRYVNV